MEQGGRRRQGLRLWRLRVPACSSRRLAAAGNEGSVASRDRESPCATWGLTASCAPRQQRWRSWRITVDPPLSV